MDRQTYLMPGTVGSLLVGFYGWIVIVFFGALLLDVVYASAIRRTLDSGVAGTVFSEAADVLLLIAAAAVLAAVGAIGGSWQAPVARNLIVASALLVLFEPVAVILLSPIIEGSGTGPWVRLLGGALTSVLALLGVIKFHLRS